MGQLGFFDADKRLEALSAKGDPLEAIDRLVPWESFCAEGYMARGGQIIDASIVPVPTQRNSRDENAELQAGAHQRRGSRSPPKCGRRTAMRAGPRSMAAASSATRIM